MIRCLFIFVFVLSLAAADREAFLGQFCLDCHDADSQKGELDLEGLAFDLEDAAKFAHWVTVHDRLQAGEMPPADKPQPKPEVRKAIVAEIATALVAADRARINNEGRAVWRRLNRQEYENTLRDLLAAPWLQVQDMLPEDGEAHRFNKLGEALDISHVQMARYLDAAEFALRQVIVDSDKAPQEKTVRYWARQQRGFIGRLHYNQFNRSPERAVFPLLGTKAQPEVLDKKAPTSVGSKNPEVQAQEAFGLVASSYEPIRLRFGFKARSPGRYRLQVGGYTFWAGPAQKRWWSPDRRNTSAGRTTEPVSLYAAKNGGGLHLLGSFDFSPEPSVGEIECWLAERDAIQIDAARLFRSRPPAWHNPFAVKDGQPGVAFQWMDVTGPFHAQWPPAGHQLLFGDQGKVVSDNPEADIARLLRRFMERAYRRPVEQADYQRMLALSKQALATGSDFEEALLTGYIGVLCSPGFLCLEERPGRLDDHALASRLSYLLWNSEPDRELRQSPADQIDRLLKDPKSERFIESFLDYWLDLRKINETAPDASLYPDYYLDDLLVESAVGETRAFFRALLHENLPARNLISADFAYLNSRLADHYDMPPIQGIELRKVPLPADSLRGGLLTQASVLKVTANGTTTSPVLRGVWVMERLVGKPPPPPPPSVPAIEPDTRGAISIRDQLAKHREQASCNACHANIDPAGLALESFDILGGARSNYRAVADGKTPLRGWGKNGQPYAFHHGPPVDCSGEMADGRAFKDVREFKALLLTDERQIARNLVGQLTTYATAAAPRFSDRPIIEKILDAHAPDYPVGDLLRAVLRSPLFLEK